MSWRRRGSGPTFHCGPLRLGARGGDGQPRAGFTLLELLLVLVIVGVLAGTVIAAFPNVGHQRQVQAEAERLALAFELARGEALRQNELWGLAVSESGYAFHRYADGSWQQVSHRPLAPWSAEHGISLSLGPLPTVAAAETPASARSRGSRDAAPNVAIHPGGEATPFAVSVVGAGGERAWIVRSDGFSRAEALPEEQAAAGARLPRFH